MDGLISDGVKGVDVELQLDSVHLEQPGVLLDERVLGGREDLYQ